MRLLSLLFKDSSSEVFPCYSRTQAVRLLSLLFKDSSSEVLSLLFKDSSSEACYSSTQGVLAIQGRKQ